MKLFSNIVLQKYMDEEDENGFEMDDIEIQDLLTCLIRIINQV